MYSENTRLYKNIVECMWTFCCRLLIGELGATLLSLHPYGIIFMLTVLLWEVLMFNICDSVILLVKFYSFFFFLPLVMPKFHIILWG